MTFELTDKLLDSIISALENQDQKFVVDSKSNLLIEQTENIKVDDEFFYKLPEWDSANGFALREQFVNELHSPLARTQLQNILRSGKGVFRGFKDTLKSYPEVEKKWHYFKNKKLINYINHWYNSLRETWGLEILDFEVEETEDLLSDDFMFSQFDFNCDSKEICNCLDSVAADYSQTFSTEITSALSDLWKEKLDKNFSEKSYGFVCRTIFKEFVGCAIFAPYFKNAPNTALLTSVVVQKKFRGLGIGKKLLSQSLDLMKSLNFKWVFIANAIVPETIVPLLVFFGFRQIESGYVLELFAN